MKCLKLVTASPISHHRIVSLLTAMSLISIFCMWISFSCSVSSHDIFSSSRLLHFLFVFTPAWTFFWLRQGLDLVDERHFCLVSPTASDVKHLVSFTLHGRMILSCNSILLLNLYFYSFVCMLMFKCCVAYLWQARLEGSLCKSCCLENGLVG